MDSRDRADNVKATRCWYNRGMRTCGEAAPLASPVRKALFMPSSAQRALLRSLPQIEEVLSCDTVKALAERLPRERVVACAREAVDAVRSGILAGTVAAVDQDALVADVRLRALALERPSLRRVVNATGVIVHTNLGRSPLAPAAVEAVAQVAASYSTLEYDPATQARGSRHSHVEHLICQLTGAEAALAVNNNAAAVMMVLAEFAAEREAVVSRGQLVEIGGSFRVPDIMAQSHALMREVGTTNKTHVADYAAAITPNTAMVLKVHPSNFRVVGFTESVGVKELRALADAENARRREAAAGADFEELLVYEDQGSGAFLNLPCFGAYAEPTVAESLAAGCDLVSFSGDKLLGGPQAGIIAGSKHLIERLKKNPLARALRLDKMTLAALEATLRLYLDEERALREIPTLRMLAEPVEDVQQRAEAVARALTDAVPAEAARVSVVPEVARAGGGALPLCDIPTCAARVEFLRGSAQDCERYLVAGRDVPVVCRIKQDAILCDARTLLNEEEIAELAAAFAEYFQMVGA